MVKPAQFMSEYLPVSVQTAAGFRSVEIRRYVSGSPWKKEWPKKAIWDLYCFVKKKGRYAGLLLLARCAAGFLALWLIFFTIGRILLLTPPSFHDGTLWRDLPWTRW